MIDYITSDLGPVKFNSDLVWWDKFPISCPGQAFFDIDILFCLYYGYIISSYYLEILLKSLSTDGY